MATTKSFNQALLALQIEAQALDLPKTKRNPHFGQMYCPLDVVLGAVVPLFNKHGFILIQSPTCMGSLPALRTRFIHVESADELSDTMLLLPGKNDPQGQGAAITYAKRYAIMSILGLTPDEDDDGNSSAAARTSPQGGITQVSTNDEAVFAGDEGSPI